MSLCSYCDNLNIQIIGLRGPDFKDGDMFAEDERKLEEVEESASSCSFCEEIVSVFYGYVLNAFGDTKKDLHIEGARVDVGSYRLRALEDTQRGRSLAHLLRLSVTFTMQHPNPSRGYIGPSIYYQKALPQTMSVSDMLDNNSLEEWPQQEPYTARLRPLVADLRLSRKWKSSCLNAHDVECGNLFKGPKPSRIRLIDVKRKCITECYGDATWVALSYVWGKVEVPMLKTDTNMQLQQPGVLTQDFVPATIFDAMTVTLALGETYLWTDSLCIMQNDPSDLSEFVPRMDSIYGHAVVTIVDAAGSNAGHGLSGVRPWSRHHQPKVFDLKGVPLIQTLDPVGTDEGIGMFADAPWSRRGWTYQESLLSPRLLIFASEQIYWQCGASTWCEDSFWECAEAPRVYRHEMDVDDFHRLDQPGVLMFEANYRNLVSKYTDRTLSYESDALDAFSGILRTLEHCTGYAFFWGLPTYFLGVALTWSTEKLEPLRVTRRTSHCKHRGRNGDIDTIFPSWSWLGWSGKISFDDLFGYLDSEHAGLVFYNITDDGRAQELAQNFEFRVYDHSRPRKELAEADYSWRDNRRTEITTAHLTPAVLSEGLAPAILAFWTSCAALQVEHDKADHFGTPVPQISCNGVTIDAYWPHKPYPRNATMVELVNFIVIGRDTLEHVRSRRELCILMVDEDENHFLSRRGMASINEAHWIALDNREWKPVFLR